MMASIEKRFKASQRSNDLRACVRIDLGDAATHDRLLPIQRLQYDLLSAGRVRYRQIKLRPLAFRGNRRALPSIALPGADVWHVRFFQTRATNRTPWRNGGPPVVLGTVSTVFLCRTHPVPNGEEAHR